MSRPVGQTSPACGGDRTPFEVEVGLQSAKMTVRLLVCDFRTSDVSRLLK